jgi:acyl-CoA thioesterase FadM
MVKESGNMRGMEDQTVTKLPAERLIVTINLVYVSVSPGSHTPTPVPDGVRTLLTAAAA